MLQIYFLFLINLNKFNNFTPDKTLTPFDYDNPISIDGISCPVNIEP
ncbi:hypothetical protein SAMN04488513_101271 [Pseudozobellia thermophila]|uniref:Uncharacterized protein n=1 Tax=Pseudozobellia thermophila TaxID=192903 RepID=A0A1M6B3E1_9FLAO|nr:hypothetical protein SAMN04488513_101271 [Pseudozobellia thermophila]